MNTLDRTQAPLAKTTEDIHLLKPRSYQLSNGIPAYLIEAGSQEIVKIELVFPAGKVHQRQLLLSAATNALLLEGTSRRSSREIAEAVDFYGAYLETDKAKDFASVTIYTLNRFVREVMPIVCEVITEATFPKEEVELYCKNEKQNLEEMLRRTEVLASRALTRSLFHNTPYGGVADPDDYNMLSQNVLKEFFKDRYDLSGVTLFVSGKADDDVIRALDDTLGKLQCGPHQNSVKPEQIALNPYSVHVHEPFSGAVQSAIRMAKQVPGRQDSMHFKIRFMTLLLGGYFGSRLMSNLREDKGYTYGIGAGLINLRQVSYLSISTQVGADVTQKALDEIYNEIKVLTKELPTTEEMDRVRNYNLGAVMKSLDGPLSQMEVFKSLIINNLDLSYYERYIQSIRRMQAEDVQEAARTVFDNGDLVEVVVGAV